MAPLSFGRERLEAVTAEELLASARQARPSCVLVSVWAAWRLPDEGA